MPKLATDKLYLTNENMECDVIAAGQVDPLYGQVQPDDYTAYARIKFGTSLPVIVGPEKMFGGVFGIHPAVLARSYQSIVHKQMNMGHKVTYLGANEDRICGCVLGASFPDEPEEGWQIPASKEEAPAIDAFCALFKQAKGVGKMLGDHLSGKVIMAVSMEFTFFWKQAGIFVPDENKVYERNQLPRSLANAVVEDQDGRLVIRKSSRNPQLVLAIGGNNGILKFSGVGYTSNPADVTTKVESFAAERRGNMMVCGAGVAETEIWSPGMPVSWPGGEFGKGVIAAVHYEGEKTMHRKTLLASPDSPVLEITLPNKVKIIRYATSVKKNFR